VPFPLIAAASLRAEGAWAFCDWLPAFLEALAEEAEDGLQLLVTLERALLRWSPQGAHRVLQVRAAVIDGRLRAGHRSSSTTGCARRRKGENFAARICPSIGSNGVHVVFSIALSGKDQLKTKKSHVISALSQIWCACCLKPNV
jgi:hypothetical protein